MGFFPYLKHCALVAKAEWLAPPPPTVAPYPGWHFCIEEGHPTPELERRLELWKIFKATMLRMPVRMRWYDGIKLGLILGNDLSRCVYVCGSYEPNEFNYLASYLKPGMVVVDAGANEGLYSLFASRRVGVTGLVLAVEPSPRELVCLRHNIARNCMSNVRVVPVALSDRTGRTILKLAENEHAGQNTLGEFVYDIQSAGTHEVEQKPLDTVLAQENVQRVDLIKADVEGAELALLMGARETLRRYKPTLLCELYGAALEHQDASSARILEVLDDFGYRLLSFDEHTGLPVPWDCQQPLSHNVLAIPA
jgi:FkbM family methyltransferase